MSRPVNLSANTSSYRRQMRAHMTACAEHEERIERALEYVDHATAAKSPSVSVESREAGNRCYARGDFGDALRLYGEVGLDGDWTNDDQQAVQSAPSASTTLAKAHGNRAVVLAAMREQAACVGDLDVAIRLVRDAYARDDESGAEGRT